jgi:hypothetical protein
VGKGLWLDAVWVVGLLSTIYLVGYSSFLTFLAIVFASSSTLMTNLEYVAQVGMYATPPFCYAAIGATGLSFLHSNRFWVFGLSAVLAETALATYAAMNPGSIPLFTDWIL